MRVIIQRVTEAKVEVNNQMVCSIGMGMLIFLGIGKDDNAEDLNYLIKKISQLRIFSDEAKKMNLSIMDVEGEILVVSQFTLHASTKKGNRPSFIRAAEAKYSMELYEEFVEQLKACRIKKVEKGVFGADMKVYLVNDGPVTIIIDSKMKDF